MFVGALSAKVAGNTVLCAETHGDKLGGLLYFDGTFFSSVRMLVLEVCLHCYLLGMIIPMLPRFPWTKNLL